MFLKVICWKTFVGTWLIKIVTSAKPRQKSIASKRLVTPFDIKYLLGFASGRCPAICFPQLPTPLVLGFDLRSHPCLLRLRRSQWRSRIGAVGYRKRDAREHERAKSMI